MNKVCNYIFFRNTVYSILGLTVLLACPVLRLLKIIVFSYDEFDEIFFSVIFGSLTMYFYFIVLLPTYLYLKKFEDFRKNFDIRNPFHKDQLYGVRKKTLIAIIIYTIVSEIVIAIAKFSQNIKIFGDNNIFIVLTWFLFISSLAVMLSLNLYQKEIIKNKK